MATPLLMNELTEAQRVSLAALKNHPGYAVLELIHMAACRRATEALVKLNPEEEGYDQKLRYRQQKARERSEFSMLILQSIDWQMQMLQAEESKNESEPNRIVKGLK